MFRKTNGECEIVLGDFGFSCKKEGIEKASHILGTPGFVAPEVFKTQEYSEKSDMFSVGLILTVLITGRNIFSGVTVAEVLKHNRKCDYSKLPLILNRVSIEA
jgi:calcium-dependent protein kinase